MKLNQILPSTLPIALSFAMVILISACSGGGGRGVSGRFCSINQPKGFNVPKSAGKLTLKSDNPRLPQGRYIYDRAELLYVYKEDPQDESTWVMIQTVEKANVNTKGGKKETVTSPFCARGLEPSTPAFSASAEGINQMTVTADNKIDFETRIYSLSWKPYRAQLKAKAENSKEAFDTPQKVFEGKGAKFNFYKVFQKLKNNRTYEISSVQEFPKDNLTIYLKTRFIREDLPKTKPTAAKPTTEKVPEAEGTVTVEESDEAPAEEAPTETTTAS